MRMTRAALRAQESYETISSEQHVSPKKQAVFDSEPLIHEDSDKENSTIQSTDDKVIDQEDASRLVLRDITGENYPTASTDDDVFDDNSSKKAKKTRGGRGRKKKAETQESQGSHLVLHVQDITGSNPGVESIIEQDCSSQQSNTTSKDSSDLIESDQDVDEISVETGSAPIEPCSQSSGTNSCVAELSNQSSTGVEVPDTAHESVVSDEKLCFPCSVEVHEIVSKTPTKPTECISKTPKFNPKIHLATQSNLAELEDASEDSFVDSIKTRSPSKLGQLQLQEQEHDSFTENIISRTPSKNISSPRVEDSVAALDDLEDALEKFSKDLPMVRNMAVESPIKQRKTPLKQATPVIRKKISTPPSSKNKKTATPLAQRMAASRTPQAAKEKLITRSTVKERVKEFESKPIASTNRRVTSINIAKKEISTNASIRPKHAPTKSVPIISSANNVLSSNAMSNSHTKQESNITKKRVLSGALSTSKPAFVPTKSTKPVTKSTFVLPGEAVAAKLKAQREERLKREEETAAMAATRKSQPKGRTVPNKLSRPSVMPRENKTSQARMSTTTKASGENKENVSPPRSTIRPASNNITVSKTRPDSTKADSSVRRMTTVVQPSTTTSKRITIGTAIVQQSGSNAPQTASHASKGKEVFSRHRANMEAEQKEKKDKEEAAKRARAEAAEKGRQASREWAEKQKKKMLEKLTVNAKVISA